MKELLERLFEQFDTALQKEAEEARQAGALPTVEKINCKIVGQIALFLADLPFDIASTMDVDILFTPPHATTKTLKELFLHHGLALETDHRLIWMPKETKFHPLFDGIYVKASFADSLYIIASKCKFQREKDRKLIEQYFAHFSKAKDKIKELGIDTKWLQQ